MMKSAWRDGRSNATAAAGMRPRPTAAQSVAFPGSFNAALRVPPPLRPLQYGAGA